LSKLLRALAAGADPDEAIAAVVRTALNADLVLRVLEGASPAAARGVLEGALDHWSSEVRAAATSGLSKLGAPPRASIWAKCPLPDAVAREVVRLGGRPRPQFDAAKKRSPKCSWYRAGWHDADREPGWNGDDPKGQLKCMPIAAAIFDVGLEWPRDHQLLIRQYDDQDGVELVFETGSENGDFTYEDDRLLLYSFAREGSEVQWCLNLLDDTEDPPVHCVDTCQYEGHFVESLSRFLALVESER
jgi:hypothetical protein